jgi:hypothetical protein
LELKWAQLTQLPTNPIPLKHAMCRVKIKDYKSISKGAQYVTLQKKKITHPSLVIYFFYTPTHKLKTGTANRLGSTNREPLGPIVMMGQSEALSSSQIIFLS